MIDLSLRNCAFYWTTTFFRSLQDQGVRHVVISPGSRSTPLTLAAASNDHFQKHVILDERSAAFTTLGIGKATNNPAVLICTSGTALANYYPAVIEARQSGVPLILATADRPPHRRATGANQAIDQLKIFGDYPVFFHEAGEPSCQKEDLDRLHMLGRQAVSTSREKRGPVHLNFPFRKPLEPEPDFLEKIALENSERAVSTEKSSKTSSLLLSGEIQNNISKAQKPLIIQGPLAPGDDNDTISSLTEQLHCPILSESAIKSNQIITGFAGFLRNEDLRNNLQPDLILRFGFQPTTKSLELALQQWEPDHHYHFASTGDWQDATFSDAEHIPWRGQPISCPEVESSADTEWLDKWKTAEQQFRSHYEETITETATLTDGAIYHHFTPQLSEDYFTAVSNSFPARDIHLFGKQSPNKPLYLNRGASGIDGVTSTALGLSLSLDKPGILFTGDLAFLHDTNALLNHDKLNNSLAIVVINNSGGSIFRMLPIEQHKEYFEPYFETPQSANIEQLVASYSIPYCKVESKSALQNISLPQWVEQHYGLSVIECKTDADDSMELRKKLWNF